VNRRQKGRLDKPARRFLRAGVERLEERVVLTTGDLAMLSATSLSPTLVAAQYAISDAPLVVDLRVVVYRSADAIFDASDIAVGQTTLSGELISIGTRTGFIATHPLDINPSLPFVLVVADPGNQVEESNEDNNTASFRKWVVGAVTHGLEIENFGGFPAWVSTMATSLQDAGYDAAIPFDWAALSGLPAPGLSTLAAGGLATQIGATVAELPLQPGDVVDLHLIGHSRGGSVVTQAAALLPTELAPLQGGFLKLSLLDPHPARNGPVPYYSHSTGPIGVFSGKLFVAFQAQANDPPLTIPAAADRTEIFLQQTLAPDAVNPLELFIISWGEVPAGGATDSAVYYNVTELVRSHYGVHDFYQLVVVPTLPFSAPVPIPPVPTPSPPTNGGPVFPNREIGRLYEFNLFRAAAIPTGITMHVLGGFDLLNSFLDRGLFGAAEAQINSLMKFIAAKRGRGLPPFFADSLLAGLLQAQFLLLPR
jgi:pimeloyl-ACP methyl ester carboxylesterase